MNKIKNKELLEKLNKVQKYIAGSIWMDRHISAIEKMIDNDNIKIDTYEVIDKSIASSYESGDSYTIQMIRLKNATTGEIILSAAAKGYRKWKICEWLSEWKREEEK